jgi:DNA-binding transcriptional LysR family regulator
MLLDQINMNYLRIFEAVYRTRSMTQAATELHLTQSGISQHIKSLEDTLNVKLFDRIKQKLIPTEDGKKFYQQLAPHLNKLEEILLELTNKDNSLRGEVTIGMPVMFGLNIVVPYLAELGKMHPLLKFRVHFDWARSFNSMLLRGDLDFAFVDEFNMDRQIETQNVYDESLLLCCTKEYLKAKGEGSNKKYFESLEYIEYDSDAPMITRWLDHHFKINNAETRVRAVLGDT